MAVAVRALLRRRAAAPPSLALLQPSLFPVWYSAPRSPLLASGAAAVGLPYVRRPQLSPAPAPPLLRYYSSKPSKGCMPPPQRQPPTSGKKTARPRLELELELELEEEFVIRLLEDLEKHPRNLAEAVIICKNANALLIEGWDNKAVAMFENGLEKAFEALDDREKALDDSSGALGSSNALSKDTLQKLQMFHKEWVDDNKFTKRELNNVQALFVRMKVRNKVSKVDLLISLLGQKKPNVLSKFKGTGVALGMCFALAVMINVIFLHAIRI